MFFNFKIITFLSGIRIHFHSIEYICATEETGIRVFNILHLVFWCEIIGFSKTYYFMIKLLLKDHIFYSNQHLWRGDDTFLFYQSSR